MVNSCVDCGTEITNKKETKRCNPCANKARNYHPSIEVRKKISKNSAKIWLGKRLSKEHIKKIVKKRIKNNSYKHTLEQRKLLSIKMSGENGSNWKGGKTPLNKILRVSSKWKIWRELVFLRDNFTCQNPNCFYCHNQIGVLLHPHHIKSLSLFPNLVFRVDNGITYCAEFHLKSGLHKNIMQKES